MYSYPTMIPIPVPTLLITLGPQDGSRWCRLIQFGNSSKGLLLTNSYLLLPLAVEKATQFNPSHWPLGWSLFTPRHAVGHGIPSPNPLSYSDRVTCFGQ